MTGMTLDPCKNFVVTYEHLTELLRLLDTKNVIEMQEGLKLLTNQLSASGKTAEQLSLARFVIFEYLSTYPEMDHFRKIWKALEESSDCDSLFVPLFSVSSLVLDALRTKSEFNSSGISYSFSIVNHYSKSIHRMLNSHDLNEQEAFLLLMHSISSLSSASAHHLFNSIDFSSKAFTRFLIQRRTRYDHSLKIDIRSLAISIVISFLRHSDLNLKGKVLDSHNLLYFCFSDLKFDESSTIITLIQSLQELILLDNKISKRKKTLFFTGNRIFLQNLVDLFYHPNEEIVSCIEGFLRLICLNTDQYFQEVRSGWYLSSEENTSPFLLKIVKLLRPLENLKMQKLFVDILEYSPNLQKWFWNEAHFNLNLDENNAVPLRFLCSVSLIMKILNLPVPSQEKLENEKNLSPKITFSKKENRQFLVESNNNQLAASIIKRVDIESVFSSCCQKSITKINLMKILANSSSLAPYYGVMLCISLFDKFIRVRNSSFLQNPEVVDDFLVSFHRRLPDFQSVIAIYNSFSAQNAPSNPLLQPKTIQLINYYMNYFSKTFSELKFDPFKFLVDKYSTITCYEIQSLIPLMRGFKLLEKRNGKSLISYVFGLLRKDTAVFEEIIDLLYSNNELISAFENENYLYFIALELTSCSQDIYEKKFSIFENSISEYFKSKCTTKVSSSICFNLQGTKYFSAQNSLREAFFNLIKSRLSKNHFLSSALITLATSYLLNNTSKCSNFSSFLQVLLQVAKKKNILVKIVATIFNDENVIKSLKSGKSTFVEIVTFCSSNINSIETSLLHDELRTQINSCISKNVILTEPWASILSLSGNLPTDNNEILKLVIFPSEYLYNSSLIQLYFERISCASSIATPNPFSVYLIQFVPEPFKLFQMFLQSKLPYSHVFVEKIISFDFESLCFAKKNLNYTFPHDSIMPDCSIQFRHCYNNGITDEEKLTLVASFHGTTSKQDIEIFNLICKYEQNQIFFGDYLLFFGENSSKHQERDSFPNISVLLTQALLSLNFKLLKQTISALPILSSNGIIYNPNFVVYWIHYILNMAFTNQIYSIEFIKAFIESGCLSFLCVCQSSSELYLRTFASHCLYFFDVIFKNATRNQNNQLEFFALLLESMQNLFSCDVPGEVTRINSFYAHFFAKSIDILQAPSHIMFPWICKFLLKKPIISTYNIRFFVDLFWSNEKSCRIWLLQLLGDSLKDEETMKMYKKCQLIQHCFNSYDASHSYLDSSHRDLLLEIIDNAILTDPIDMLLNESVGNWLLGQIKIASSKGFSCLSLFKTTVHLLNCLAAIQNDSISCVENEILSNVQNSGKYQPKRSFLLQLDEFCLILKEALLQNEFSSASKILNLLMKFNLEDQIRFVVNSAVIKEIPIFSESVSVIRKLIFLHADIGNNQELSFIYRQLSIAKY